MATRCLQWWLLWRCGNQMDSNWQSWDCWGCVLFTRPQSSCTSI